MRTNCFGSSRRFECRHRFAKEMSLPADVQPAIIPGRLDPVDLVDTDEHALPPT